MNSRANYGLDAPGVIRNFFLIGIGCIAFGILSQLYFQGIPPMIGAMITGAGPWFLFFGAMMIFSSKVGKYIACERLIDLVQLQGNEQVLDAGCGRGLVLNAVAKRLTTGKAVGVDIWQTKDQSGNDPKVTLQNAEVEGVREKVEVVNGDMRDLPFERDRFDVILSSLAIRNIPSKEERKTALSELMRVLKPGGRFALLDFQNTEEYLKSLQEMGMKEVRRVRVGFTMFPFVRVVVGRKP